jgi:transcriptional regulator with XRE-family HTH domain
MTTSHSAFAARLKALRGAAGLTQEQLADAAGMHKLGIAKLEQGLREPTWATVQALARALGVTCLDFVAKEGEAVEYSPPQMGRPRKPPTSAQDAASEGKASEGPAEQKKTVRKSRGKRKG